MSLRARSEINITPLVDIVLVLLIIFMVLTPLMEKQLDLRVADSVSGQPTDEKPDGPVLRVAADGSLLLGTEKIADSELPARLRSVMASPPILFFDADDGARYQRAVEALDIARGAVPGLIVAIMAR